MTCFNLETVCCVNVKETLALKAFFLFLNEEKNFDSNHETPQQIGETI